MLKLDYKRLYQDRETKLIFTKIKLAAANEEIERLTKIVREKEKFPYLQSEAVN